MDLFKIVAIFGLLFCNIFVKGQSLDSNNLATQNSSFEKKEVSNSEDYPEGFADGLGKGAIEAASSGSDSGKKLSKVVESWPETMATVEPDDYETSEKDGFRHLSPEYFWESTNITSNITVELVQLPSVDLYYKGCTISSIDPNSQPSSLAFDVRGILDDCESECLSETLYKCSSYTFGGPGTYCVLHGPIDYGQVYPKDWSEYSITDINCVKNKSEFSNLQLCQFKKHEEIQINPANIVLPYRTVSVLNKDHCELLCKMHPYILLCTSFAFNPDVFTIGDANCVLFSRNISFPIKFAKGSYDVYENPCFLSDYANI